MKLEVGKTYVARNGDVVKIVKTGSNPIYPFRGDDDLGYAEDGRFFVDDDHAEEFNLVSEYKPVENKSLRGHYAVLLMQSIIADKSPGSSFRTSQELAKYAVEYADALIAELEKSK